MLDIFIAEQNDEKRLESSPEVIPSRPQHLSINSRKVRLHDQNSIFSSKKITRCWKVWSCKESIII